MKAFFSVLLMCVFLLSLAGCGWKSDRCWVDDYQYMEAKKIYEETQNLDLVVRNLENQKKWRRCEINEIVYRIKKEYHLEDDTLK